MRIRKIQFLTGAVLIFFLISYFFFLVSFFSCEKTTAPLNELQVTLTAPYIGFTEVDLLLQTKNTEANTQYQLFRDDSLISHGALLQAGTIIIDTLLLPAHHYSYQAFLIKDQKRITQSREQQVTTLDTTSHDFQWQAIEFPSPHGSGGLYDVAIVNENDIWAVGEIYSDSVQDWLPYNAVHWDGSQWELRRIFYNDNRIISPIRGILVFSSEDILLAAGSIFHYNGQTAYISYQRDINSSETIEKLWASSSDNIFGVGNEGLIVHYNGQNWQKLESPATNLLVQDIWGAVDIGTGNTTILALACNLFTLDGTQIWQISAEGVKMLPAAGLPFNMRGVWSWKGREWYVCGSGLYKMSHLSGSWERVQGLPGFFQEAVRGTGPNNIFVVGDYGLVAHWNGSSWKTFEQNPQYVFLGLAVTDNLVVAVGTKVEGIVAGSAVLLTGTRND
jgi:hypothetical protein